MERVFALVEEYAPGFRASVLGVDALSPLELERVFGLQHGNIMHGRGHGACGRGAHPPDESI